MSRVTGVGTGPALSTAAGIEEGDAEGSSEDATELVTVAAVDDGSCCPEARLDMLVTAELSRPLPAGAAELAILEVGAMVRLSVGGACPAT